MKLDLPQKFVQKMKLLLGEEYEQFIASYDAKRYYGIRVNELKTSAEYWHKQTTIKEHLTPIPWCKEAYYYNDEVRPAKHPHYHAGLYYIQEPTAMVPAELLDVQPGHRVLDLCAAPGGKSTQIASKLQGKGVLVSNDIATERTKPLAKNIELAGVRNAIVLNEHPANIAAVFSGWFDRILIDAPCSGEGMFRKTPAMIDEWEDYSVERCAVMQRDILDEVSRMLAPGGRIVYSTCTFSPEENEQQIARFIAMHPDFSVVPIQHQWGWSCGNPYWVSEELRNQLSEEQLQSISGTVRLWPHLTEGEGHFVAVLKRSGEEYQAGLYSEAEQAELTIEWPKKLQRQWHSKQGESNGKRRDNGREKGKEKGKQFNIDSKRNDRNNEDQDTELIFEQFRKENIVLRGHGREGVRAVLYGSRVYFQPNNLPSLEGLKVVRAGWPIGEVKHNKFSPYHSLAMALNPEEAARVIQYSEGDEQLLRYLKGETIFVEEHLVSYHSNNIKKNGYVLICVDNYPVGFGKYVDGMIKNELPAGWRMI